MPAAGASARVHREERREMNDQPDVRIGKAAEAMLAHGEVTVH